jgi:hypothetical protein
MDLQLTGRCALVTGGSRHRPPGQLPGQLRRGLTRTEATPGVLAAQAVGVETAEINQVKEIIEFFS